MAKKEAEYGELKDTVKNLQERGYSEEQIKGMFDTIIDNSPKEEKMIPESKIVKCIEKCLGEVVDKCFELDAGTGMVISMLLTIEFAKLQCMILDDDEDK